MKSILSKRIINATIQQLYNAYSKPELLIQWWGPHGFANRFNEFNFCENGLWDYHMIDTNGKEYHNQTIFKTILPNNGVIVMREFSVVKLSKASGLLNVLRNCIRAVMPVKLIGVPSSS